MRAAIYCRLSQDRSGKSENTTIQEAECQAYAEDEGWEVVGVYVDDDISASKFSTKPRPDYDRLLADVAANKVNVILVTEKSRLHRRVEEMLEVIKLAEQTSLRYIHTTEGEVINLATPQGIHEAIGGVNTSMYESARTSVRVKRKKGARAKGGGWNGGGRSYGFEGPRYGPRDEDGNRELINLADKRSWGIAHIPEEAAVIREVADRYNAGESWRDMADDLNKRGIHTAEGKQWRAQNLKTLLFKIRNIGIREHDGAEYKAAWEPILTMEQWNLMHATRARKAAKYGSTYKAGRKYLLTGFAYCGRCNAPMGGSSVKRNGGKKRRYRCDKDAGGCGKIFRAADPLEAWVVEAVLWRFDSPETARALRALDESDDRTEELLAEYQTRKLKLDELVTDYGEGLLDKAQFARAKSVAEAKLDEARQALNKSQDAKTGILPVDQTIRESWEASGFDWKQSVIGLLVERVNILPNKGGAGAQRWNGYLFNPDAISVVWKI
jgi:site-specific DNA recombinase